MFKRHVAVTYYTGQSRPPSKISIAIKNLGFESGLIFEVYEHFTIFCSDLTSNAHPGSAALSFFQLSCFYTVLIDESLQ